PPGVPDPRHPVPPRGRRRVAQPGARDVDRHGLRADVREAAPHRREGPRPEGVSRNAPPDLPRDQGQEPRAGAPGDGRAPRAGAPGAGAGTGGPPGAQGARARGAPVKSLSLEGRVAVVTGGASGIGLSLALGLAEAGADVVPTSRRKAEVDAAAAQITA